jgi:3-oxoacyl-[acyl-carrier protein] reductase
MADRYANFAHTGPGRAVVRRLGLPDPPRLHRYRPGDPLVSGPVLLGGPPGGRLRDPVGKILGASGVEVAEPGTGPSLEPPERPPMYAAVVFDATGVTGPEGLQALYDFFHPYARSLYPCGRVIVLGTLPEAAEGVGETTAQWALEGFVRSVGREFRRGITAQLVRVAPGAEGNLESTLRFLLSARSAYVSGQVIRVEPAPVAVPGDWDRPLAGKVALVTGAARGIGEAMARVLTRDGAQVVCVDRADAGDALARVANEVNGSALQVDITAPDAPERLVAHVEARHGTLDILVHNAGITRDRTLARMDADTWRSVLDVNLLASLRVNDAMLAGDHLADGGRVVGVSSITGIAGNRGQTNYATSKAGVIGWVRALAPGLRERGITVNAVAPGFIETRLTARMPVVAREAGRRMNSMSQAGLPVDVAETVAWLASPGSAGITGQVVRVCGQALLGT